MILVTAAGGDDSESDGTGESDGHWKRRREEEKKRRRKKRRRKKAGRVAFLGVRLHGGGSSQSEGADGCPYVIRDPHAKF